jgi:hypothetical protein
MLGRAVSLSADVVTDFLQRGVGVASERVINLGEGVSAGTYTLTHAVSFQNEGGFERDTLSG